MMRLCSFCGCAFWSVEEFSEDEEKFICCLNCRGV